MIAFQVVTLIRDQRLILPLAAQNETKIQMSNVFIVTE